MKKEMKLVIHNRKWIMLMLLISGIFYSCNEKQTVSRSTLKTNYTSLEALIEKIEINNLSYLADTIYGEALIFEYNLFTELEDGSIDYPFFILKTLILKSTNNYNAFLSKESTNGNFKETLLKKLKSRSNDSDKITVSCNFKDSEFDAACIFHFALLNEEYYLIRIQNVG